MSKIWLRGFAPSIPAASTTRSACRGRLQEEEKAQNRISTIREEAPEPMDAMPAAVFSRRTDSLIEAWKSALAGNRTFVRAGIDTRERENPAEWISL